LAPVVKVPDRISIDPFVVSTETGCKENSSLKDNNGFYREYCKRCKLRLSTFIPLSTLK
jgi:hypothetical protein